jgi:hypothetical protein
MSMFPDDDKVRKMLPIFKYLTEYFPKAHREVTKVCVVNNVRYNPDRSPADINWNRGKSPDQLGSAFRHMLESAVDGKVFEDVPEEVAKITGIGKVYVLAEAMWRLGAQLELAIEHAELEELHNAVITEILDINKQQSVSNAILDQRPDWVDAVPRKPFKPYAHKAATPCNKAVGSGRCSACGWLVGNHASEVRTDSSPGPGGM